MTQDFYMICRAPTHPNAKTEPKARFAHIDTARDEARRLAHQMRADFVILKTVEHVTPTDHLTKRIRF